MLISDWVAIISLVIAVIALGYSIFSNTKKYELTYQYYNDILNWHNEVVEILIALKYDSLHKQDKSAHLIKLSALIESGRFYFPNIDKKDGFGKDKPYAYQGYRNVILDFLVFEYQIFDMDNSSTYIQHADSLQRLFTSHIFQYLKPEEQSKKIKRHTDIAMTKKYTINDFLHDSPESIYAVYPINDNCDIWTTPPSKRK